MTKQRFPKVPFTLPEFDAHMQERQERVLELVRALHLLGFSSVLMESTAIGTETYYCRVTIDSKELDAARVSDLVMLANSEGHLLSLRDDYNTGPRLSFWVSA